MQTLVSGIKHGTELNMYRGTLPFASSSGTRLAPFPPPEPDEQIAPFYPHTLGSGAGVVTAVGPEVKRFKPGDLVHGEWKHRQTALLPEKSLNPVHTQVDGETMVFTDPARFALAAVHDAEIKLGDRVAIFGMGATGKSSGPLQSMAPSGRDKELFYVAQSIPCFRSVDEYYPTDPGC